MKIGIMRNVDALGRIVVPMEFRKALEIKIGDPVEISLEGDQVVIGKYEPTCYCCEKESDTYEEIFDRKLCPECYEHFVKSVKTLKSELVK